MLGLPGWEHLTTRESFDRVLMLAVAKRVRDLREQEREAQAVHIANAVGRLFKR